MGIILIGIALLGLAVAQLGIVLGVLVALRNKGRPGFWRPCLAAAAVSALCQYAYALDFFHLRIRETGLLLAVRPMLGWHLLPPFLLAGAIGFASRRSEGASLQGVAAGLLFSVPVVVVLAIPIAFALGL